MSRDTATGNVMVKRKTRQSAACPRYQHPDGSILHVLTYTSISPTTLRKSLLSEPCTWMRANLAHTITIYFIYKGLIECFKSTSHECKEDIMIYTNETNTNSAFKLQINIGWHKILCDVLTEELIAAQ